MARPGKNVVGTPRKHRCRVTPTGRPPRPEEVQGECEGNRGGGEDGRASDTCLQLLQLPESPREPVQLQFRRSCPLTGTQVTKSGSGKQRGALPSSPLGDKAPTPRGPHGNCPQPSEQPPSEVPQLPALSRCSVLEGGSEARALRLRLGET